MHSYQRELTDNEYEAVINETSEDVRICGMHYQQGHILRKIDPIAFRCGKLEHEDTLPYMCGECKTEYDDEDEAEECCKQEHLAELLEALGFLGTDESIECSLYEYRFVYRERDSLLVIFDGVSRYDMVHVSKDDISEAIKEMDDGFYSFIGVSKAEYSLSPVSLEMQISEIRNYKDLLTECCVYSMSIDDVINQFAAKEG